MWILIAIGVVVVCVIAAAAAGESEKQEKTAAAKRPEALVRLFNEEFRSLGASLTYAQADQAVKNWEKLEKSFAWLGTRNLFGTKFSSDKSKKRAAQLLNERVLSGPAVDQMARDNPSLFVDKMMAILESSKTLSGS